MVFNASLPADSTKLRDLGVVIRPNWTAINTAEETFAPDAINFGEQGADLAAFADIYRLYSKADSLTAYTELFGINSNGDVTQLTFKTGSSIANGFTYLPGQILLQWGRTASVGSGSTVTFPTAFGAGAYSVTVTPISPNGGTWGVLGTPTATTFDVEKTAGANSQIFWQAIGIAKA